MDGMCQVYDSARIRVPLVLVCAAACVGRLWVRAFLIKVVLQPWNNKMPGPFQTPAPPHLTVDQAYFWASAQLLTSSS